MNKFFKKNNNVPGICRQAKMSRGGFTLVETLVAIAIFTISLTAMMSVLGKGVTDTDYAKAKDTASYLAQEGLEYMHNMRDTYMLYSTSPLTGWTNFNLKLLGASCDQANGCYFNADNLFSLAPPMPMTQISLNSCNDATCSLHPLLYDSTTGKYNYTTGTNSGFIRTIKVVLVVANQETKVSSTVTWKQGSGTYSTTFSENLFNWIE